MSEAKHTPGPWRVRAFSQRMTIQGNVHQVTDEAGYPAAFVPAWNDPEPGKVGAPDEAIANAELIAAAPTMAARIAALEETLLEWDRLSLVIDSACRNDPWGVGPSLKSDIDAVIRRARALLDAKP